jgi:hypothetical protein
MKGAPFKLDVFDELKESIADAAERVFRDAIAAHSDETFYAFVLTSYRNCFGGASANTVENHERIWSAVQEDDRDPEWKWHYKWASRTWGDYELIGDQSWSARRLNSMAAFLRFEQEYNRALDCSIAEAD